MTSYAKYVMSAPGRDVRRDELTLELMGLGFGPILDDSQDGLMFTWLRTLKHALEADREWTVIVTDDAPPFPGWDRELPYALEHSPSPVLSLTHFARAGELAAQSGFAYGVEGIWGPAIALKTEIIESVIDLAYAVLRIDRSYQHDDGVLLIWARLTGNELAYTARALFDHRADWRSLMGHSGDPDKRRPLLTVDAHLPAFPAWDKPGTYRHKLYIGNPTKRVMEALGAPV